MYEYEGIFIAKKVVFFSTTTKNNREKTQFGVILAPRKPIPRKLTFQNISYQKPCACAKQDSIWGLVNALYCPC